VGEVNGMIDPKKYWSSDPIRASIDPWLGQPVKELDRNGAGRTVVEQAAYEQGVAAAKEAVEAQCGDLVVGGRLVCFDVLEAIDAACLPFPEPEIEVTDEMARAGVKAWQGMVKRWKDNPPHEETVVLIYRSMRALEQESD
jgi:hypothetical protein